MVRFTHALFSLCALAALAACISPEEQHARRQQIEIADHKECLKLGFKAQTDAYAECRLRLKELRVQELAINNGRAGLGYYGRGYYFGHGRPWYP